MAVDDHDVLRNIHGKYSSLLAAVLEMGELREFPKEAPNLGVARWVRWGGYRQKGRRGVSDIAHCTIFVSIFADNAAHHLFLFPQINFPGATAPS